MRICSVDGCDRKHVGNGYCNRHYQQFYNYGKITSTNSRTTKDPNEFIFDGDVCWVILYDKLNEEIARAKFLLVYYEKLKNYKWYLNDKGYAATSWDDKDGHHFGFLHQAIVDLSGKVVQFGEDIDHKDGDPLNCLDENLRICTFSQNCQNRRKISNVSGYKGVCWRKDIKKWKAYITCNEKYEHLGYFAIKEDAARAYNAAAIKYFGEFALLNEGV